MLSLVDSGSALIAYGILCLPSFDCFYERCHGGILEAFGVRQDQIGTWLILTIFISLPVLHGPSELYFSPLESGDNKIFLEFLGGLSMACNRLIVGLLSYSFKGEVAIPPVSQAQRSMVLINIVNRRRGLICSPSHAKLSTRQVMVLNINALEVRRTT